MHEVFLSSGQRIREAPKHPSVLRVPADTLELPPSLVALANKPHTFRPFSSLDMVLPHASHILLTLSLYFFNIYI